jgi:hypothetical protein
MNRYELYIASLALESVPAFSGSEEESAKLFLRDLEEAFDLSNVNVDKYKKYHLKEKLKGLPLQWYESLTDIDEYQSWDLLKERFIQQFYKSEQRLKYINRKLLNIRQKEEECVKTLYFCIRKLFNEYKQITGKSLQEEQQVEYFINGLLPHYKVQLNNHYQYTVGVYVKVSLEDVKETALRLERNAIVYKDEMKRLREGIDCLHNERSNSHSTVNLISEHRSRKTYNSNSEGFNNYSERCSDSCLNSGIGVRDNAIEGYCYSRENNNTIDSQIVPKAAVLNEDEEIENKSNQYKHLLNEVDVNSSESCNSMIFNANVVKCENTMKEVEQGELKEDANKEDRVDNKRCGSDEEFNKSDVNFNSAEQYKLSLVECVTVDNVTERDLQLMDFKVKANDCYYYGINRKNTIKEVEVVEETHKEERIYNWKCELTEEVNKSDVNQYCFSSIGAVEGGKKNLKLMDFNVKANGYYNYWNGKKEENAVKRNEEKKIVLLAGKEPKPPWKITMFTEKQIRETTLDVEMNYEFTELEVNALERILKLK